MIRPVEDFMRAVSERGITRWGIHRCSICGYQCGYVIAGDSVLYDSGCGCTGGVTLEPRSWDDIAKHYNRNQPENNPRISPEWLADVDAFWGFDSVSAG